jgi:hypothetical protein
MIDKVNEALRRQDANAASDALLMGRLADARAILALASEREQAAPANPRDRLAAEVARVVAYAEKLQENAAYNGSRDDGGSRAYRTWAEGVQYALDVFDGRA